MRRLRSPLIICAYLAIAIAPIAFRYISVSKLEVHGALAETPRPSPAFSSITDETFQGEFTKWFESTLGLKAYSIHADNSLLYHLLGDTKFGSQVILGGDHTLFMDEDISYFNRDELLYSQPDLDRKVEALATLQARLAAQGRGFVPVIIPSKTTIYRDAVPPAWTRSLGDPRLTDVKVYQMLVAALDRRGVKYVDARALFSSSKDPREALWGRDARHWTEYSACLVMSEVAKQYVALTGKAMGFRCEVVYSPGKKSRDDYDLWRLLNAWHVPRVAKVADAVVLDGTPAPAKPKTLIIGTSFCWGLLRQASQSGQFGVVAMDYYEKVYVSWPDDTHYEIKPHTSEWRGQFLDKDLYVLDMFETFLGAPDSYIDSFVTALSAELR